MAGGTHSQGAFTKLLIEPGASPHTFDANSIRLEYLRETLSKHGRHGGNEGIRGTLQHESARIRELTYFAFGDILMYLSPNDIDALADDVWGLNESPLGTFTTQDSLPYFGILIDTDYATFEFQDCKCDWWMIRAQAPNFRAQGEPEMMFCQMRILASTVVKDTAWPSPEPSLGSAVSDEPYIFSDSDSGITLVGSTRAVEELAFVSYHKLKAKYANALEPHSIRPQDRDIRMKMRLPWNSANDAVYGQAVAGSAASMVFTNGTMSATFTLGKLQAPDNSPIVPGKDQVSLEVDGAVRGNGATADLVIVNDNTP